jgi:DNA-binding CsgD family transcriptional regulator/ligand-binding sensor domain-containing protein
MRSWITGVLLSLVVLSEAPAQELKLNIPRVPLAKYIDPSVYNGGIQNWSFSQDTLGILYVANNYGLLEFDGSNWFNHLVPNTTKIRSVYCDPENRVFIGGQGQIGYFIKRQNEFAFISLLERLDPDNRIIEEVWRIFPYDGKVFFNTSFKLFVFENDKFYSLELPGEIERAFNVNDELIIQFVDQGLFKYNNSNFIQIQGTETIVDEITSILPYKQGFLSFTTSGIIYSYDEDGLTQKDSEIRSDLSSSPINTCIQLSNGDIAIGTQNEGLYILSKELQLKNHFTKNKGLSNRTVLALLEDGFNNLWVGLNNGIDYLELSSPLSLINEEVGLEGTGYASVLYNDQVYLGTNNGLFAQGLSEPGSRNPEYNLIAGSEGQVNNLSIAAGDLILNHHKGAFQIKGNSLEQFHDIGSWKVKPTSKPNLFIGGSYNGLSFFEKSNNSWKHVRDIEGLTTSSRVFEFENDSTLWMTHGYKGAYLVAFDRDFQKTKNINFFGEGDGFPSNILISVYNLNNSLIFTGEVGIYDFNEGLKRFTQNEILTRLLGNDHVSKVTTNTKGDLIFLANRELGFLKQEAFGKFSEKRYPFNRINALISDDLENINILDDQNILIGAKEGFIHFNPDLDYRINDNFNVILQKVEIEFVDDSTNVFIGEFFNETKLNKNKSIKFQFAAPYFDGFEDLRYSYRLVGFQDNWSDWSVETIKEYTNLPAGNFSFQVKAKNVYENESEVLAIPFRIIPKWYQSNWAYASYVLAAIISFGLFSYFQDKKYKKEKEILHQSKEAAIKSKDAELSQVSHQSKLEIENLRNEKLRSEIDYKNNELASVTMHLLNKNEFVQSVRKRIESMISIDGITKDELKRIVKTINRNLEEDDSWDQFAFHFDQVHGDFLKNLSADEIKLTPQETKLAAYLRMNMSSKEIANLMNISVRGVELARYRLRKKLNLERDQNLVDHLLQL